MVLGADYQYKTLEHEYAHTQLPGLGDHSFQRRLFLGVDEALAEKTCSKPSTYKCQRFVVDEILKQHPYLESFFYGASRGKVLAKMILFRRLVGSYGLKGFLQLAFMAPHCPSTNNLQRDDPVGYATYRKPCDVLNIFSNRSMFCW